MKKNLTKLAKKNLIFRTILRKALYLYRWLGYKKRTHALKVDNQTIIFSCYGGASYACSPKAIYEAMLEDEKWKNYQFIWAFKKPEEHQDLQKNKNTKILKQNSREYQRSLATAQYWIFNYKIAEHLYPKKNQLFLQCWHGTPLKRLGLDLIHFDNSLNTKKGMQKRYKIEAKKFSFFLSPSKFATEKFISAWGLKQIGKENIIIEKGYPRNDFLYNYTKQDQETIKKQLGIPNTHKKIILYAPTYRGNSHQSGLGYVYHEEVDFSTLQQALGEDYIILFRAHYFIANSFDFEKYKGFVYDVSKIDDINQLYIITDLLITDYSSVFFDYANLKRPIIFHMYDQEHYQNQSNGFYIDLKELPGPITKNDQELIRSHKNNFKRF